MLIIFSGLPGAGKSSLCKQLARRISATYIRIDTIECAIRNSSSSANEAVDAGAGYIVGYAIAEDNLKTGRTVIADSVNPIKMTRDDWLEVAKKASVKAIEVEVICSDTLQHEKRVEIRKADIKNHKLPNWQNVLDREYEEWDRDRIVIDTANRTIEQNIDELLSNTKFQIKLCNR